MPDDEHGAAIGRPARRTPADSDPAAGHTSPLPMSNVQSGLRLDELLREVQGRLAEVVARRGRMQGLDRVQRESAFVGRLARRVIVKAGDVAPDPSRPRSAVAGWVSVWATVRTGRCMAHQV